MPDSMDIQGWSQTLVALFSTWGLRVIGALVVLVVGRIVAGGIRGSVRKGLERRAVDPTLIPFVSSLVYYLALAFVAIAVINLFGVPTASFVAILGAAGLAIGLALQGTLSNFSSGVMLLIFRPFKAGDYVEAGGTAGSVRQIGVFTTQLDTPDNVRIILPNSAVWGGTVKNYAANENRRNDMVMGISYGDDIGLAMETIRKVLSKDNRVLPEPAPVIAVSELADSSVNIVVRPWCRKEDYWGLRFDLMRTMKEELEAAGCSIPFPQRDVHLFQETSAS